MTTPQPAAPPLSHYRLALTVDCPSPACIEKEVKAGTPCGSGIAYPHGVRVALAVDALLTEVQRLRSVPADLEAAARLTVDDFNAAIGLPDGDKPVTDKQLAALLAAATAKALRLAGARMRALEEAGGDILECFDTQKKLREDDTPAVNAWECLEVHVDVLRALLAPEVTR